jgi:hypothetical protein
MISACFLFFCWFAPPAAVPDGAGGYVPFTNSRVMPDGSLRPYAPAIDGVPSPVPDGPYPFIVPMPGVPADFPDLVEGPPPPPDYSYREGYAVPGAASPQKSSSLSPRRHDPTRTTHQSCYDGNGKFIGADNQVCR